MQYMRVKTDTNGTLDDVQVASAQHATNATNDANGNNIVNTYVDKTSEQQITGKKTFVAQGINISYGSNYSTNINRALSDSEAGDIDILLPPESGTLALISGSYLNMTVGNANHATNATNATGDIKGNNIFNTYLGRWAINTTKNGTTSRDFNAYTETGVYELIADANNAFTNNPSSIYNSTTTDGNWFLIVLKRDSNYITQIAVSVRADLAISIRNCSNGSWGEWKQLSEFGMNVRHSIDINNQSYGRFSYNGQSYTINKDATNVNDWWFRIGASGNVITVGISFQPKITLNKGTRYRIAYGLPNNQQNESGWWIIADSNGAAHGGIEIDQNGNLYFTPYSENIATSTYMEGGAAYITNE